MEFKFQKFELFPTTVLRFNLNGLFTQEEKSALVKDINLTIEEKTNLQLDGYTPMWQSLPYLFTSTNTNKNSLWAKLKKSFEQCCTHYMHNVSDFCKNQESLSLTGSRAWFYKNCLEVHNEDNPPHNHYPSFLSGVYYLHSNDSEFNGTEFCDSRTITNTRNVEIVPIVDTWVIFPGWLEHKTGQIKNKNNERYIVAADCYVSVSCF